MMKSLSLVQRYAIAGCLAAIAFSGTVQAKAVVINFGTISTMEDFSGAHFLKADKKLKIKFKISGPLTFDFSATGPDDTVISRSGGDGKYKIIFGRYPDKGLVSYSLTTAEVAEPATWALMILGFGAVGALARRGGRRLQPVQAPT
jgi:hypothetical protein